MKAKRSAFMAFLIQANEGADGVILPLGRSVMLIGRDEDSNLYLEASEISKNHASIFSKDGFYHVKDNRSLNGTLINGQRVTEHLLQHDDVIEFGPYRFRVDLRNPMPQQMAGMEDADVKHSGIAYTSSIKLKEVKGSENSGQLHVVIGSDVPPTAPKSPVDLPSSGLLAEMSSEDRKSLAVMGSMRAANSGAKIIHQGNDAGELILILSGKFEARLDGVDASLATFTEGDWVGELNIFDPSGATCSVVALNDATYWAISRSNLEGFLSTNHTAGVQLLVGLANLLGMRLRKTMESGSVTKSPAPVYPWIIAAACGGFAILSLFGFVNERKNTGFQEAESISQLAEMASLIEERENELESLQSQLDLKKSQVNALQDKVSHQDQAASHKDHQKPAAPVAQSSTPGPKPEPKVVEAKPEPVAPKPESSPSELQGVENLYPPELTITKKTQVPLKANGVTSGSMTLSPGLALKVLGADSQNVFVEVGEDLKEIPKSNTNFAEALSLYLENLPAPETTPALSSAPKPSPTPTPTPAVSSTPEPVELADLAALVESLDILEVLEDVQGIKASDKNAVSRFVRAQEPKWEKAAQQATLLLSRTGVPKAYATWLTQLIETSQMFKVARFPLLEKQLLALDSEWIKFQAESAAGRSDSQ
jgi:CRP-like cAMP-binding protein